MKKPAVLLLFLCCYLSSRAQKLSPADSILVDRHFALASQYCYSDLEQSLRYLDSVDQVLLAANEWKDLIVVSQWRIHCSRYWQDLQLMHRYLKQAEERLSVYQKELDSGVWEEQWVDVQVRLGDYEKKTGNMEAALDRFNKLIRFLKQKEDLPQDLHKFLIISYIHVGDIQKVKGNYQEAILNYQYCIDFEKETARDEKRKAYFESSYARVAEINRLLLDYDAAEVNYLKAISYYESLIRKDPQRISEFRDYIIPIHHGLSRIYQAKGQFAKAFVHAGKALNYPQNEGWTKAFSFQLLGELYQDAGMSEKALVQYRHSVQRLKQLYQGEKHHQLGKAYLRLGSFYQETGKLELAKEPYQQALIQLVPSFNDTHFLSNPDLQGINFKRELLSGLLKKGQLQFDLAKLSGGDLSAAWKTCQLGVQLIDSMRYENRLAFDTQGLLEESYPLFELVFDLANELGGDYLEMAYQVIEKSKALVLWEAQLKTDAVTYSGIPEEQLRAQKEWRNTLLGLEKELHTATRKGDPRKVQYLQNRAFECRQELKSLEKNMEDRNPRYFQFRYGFSPVTAGNLKSYLAENQQSLLEFFIGEQHIYIFAITPDGIHLKRLPVDKDLLAMAAGLKDHLYHKDRQAYINKARTLYDALFSPLMNINLTDRLIIIPDGQLGHIPFDVLLYEDPAQEEGFQNFPFLLKKYRISYHYSASLLTRQERRKAPSATSAGLLAFAPSFGKLHPGGGPLAMRSLLDTLEFNQPEVLAIRRLYCGDIRLGQEATRRTFLKLAANYRCLHIASHAQLNDRDPNFSFIAFTNQADTSEAPFRLYIRELYELHLNADLVVLSACETGAGESHLGEGVISLARGFAYAGAASVVTTLWRIDDEATRILMEYFYGNLKAGQPKDEALRNAKLQYLGSSDRFAADPFFWASFIPVGNMEPVELNGDCIDWRYFLAGIGMLALIGLVFVYRRRIS